MDGKPRSGGQYKLKKDAEAARERKMAEFRAGTYTNERDSLTVDAVLTAWLAAEDADEARGEKSDEATPMYHAHTERFVRPQWGGWLLSDLALPENHDKLQEWVDGLRHFLGADGKPLVDQDGQKLVHYKHSYVTHTVHCLNKMFGFAVQKLWLPRNPLKDRRLKIAEEDKSSGSPSRSNTSAGSSP